MLTLKLKEHQKELLIKLAAGITTVLVCYGLMVHPAFREVGLLQKGLQEAQKRLLFYKEIRHLEENLARSEGLLALSNDRSTISAKISDLASQYQIEVQAMNPKTAPGGEYLKLLLEMDGKGSFFSLLDFLKAIETGNLNMSIKDISLLRPAPSSGETNETKNLLQIRLVMETLLRQQTKKAYASK